MSNASEPVGTLDAAIAHTQRLLTTNPVLAAEQAREILKVVPGHPPATLLLANALKAAGDGAGALAILEPLVKAQPNWAAAHLALGTALTAAGRGEDAVVALKRAVHLKPDLADAWRELADHLAAIGDEAGADAAYAQSIKASTRDPRLLEPAAALCDGRIAVAESLLREHLKKHPTDIAAIRMLAEVAARLGRYGDAETLLTRCLELAPGFSAARHNYALVLHRQNRTVEALPHIDRLLVEEPRNPSYRILKAAMLGRLGEYERSIEAYEQVLGEYPNQAKVWMSYGHALKTAGKQKPSIDAYRRSIQISPGLGEAYWSLANLKTVRFTDEELTAMQSQLARSDLSNEDRLHFDFAVGKALEDRREFAKSFEHYALGNRLRRKHAQYRADDTTANVQRAIEFYSRSFLEARQSQGASAADPIFIVGLPRSGSTLLEQILSSHSAVEGTMELPDILSIARKLAGRKSRDEEPLYPQALAELDASELRAFGEQYLAQTSIQRKEQKPYFIDKMPNNWLHVGLIHLILPNAKIVDARRHPLSCCFSNFKQHFARGQHFTYDLEEIGRFYRDYVRLMDHFDEVLPGRIHRVYYERMVGDTESEVRRVLAYCGLPFEDACLRFYESERAVRTASSEQVRSPIYRDAVDQWVNYESWLAPLKAVLGEVLTDYPVRV